MNYEKPDQFQGAEAVPKEMTVEEMIVHTERILAKVDEKLAEKPVVAEQEKEGSEQTSKKKSLAYDHHDGPDPNAQKHHAPTVEDIVAARDSISNPHGFEELK